MSYNSSYSVSLEDGVDILFPDNFCSDDDRKHLGYMNEASDASYPSDSVQSDLSKMQSFTFEAQVSYLLCLFMICTFCFLSLFLFFHCY